MSVFHNLNPREDAIFKGKVKDVLIHSYGAGGLVTALVDFCARERGSQAMEAGLPHTASAGPGLTYEQFLEYLADHNVELTPFESAYLCRSFDDEGHQYISGSTFLRHLAGLNLRRMRVVQQAWDHVPKDANGEAPWDVLLDTHTNATAKRKDAFERDLMSTFSNDPLLRLRHSLLSTSSVTAVPTAEKGDAGEAATQPMSPPVSWPDFLAFYAGVSQKIPTDEAFEMHLLRCWAADEPLRPTMKETQREWGPSGDPLAIDGPRYVKDALNMQLSLSTKSYNYTHMQRTHPYVEPLPPLNRPDIMQTTVQREFKRYTDDDAALVDPLSTRRGQLV